MIGFVVHPLEMVPISQDEARLVCPVCEYVRAVKLTLDGRVDGHGKRLVAGPPGTVHPWPDVVFRANE